MAVNPATPTRHEVQQTSTEIIKYNIEFASVLADAIGSPSLSTVSVSVVDIPAGDPVVGVVTSSSVNGTTIEFDVSGGINNTEYLATFSIVLNDGQTLDEHVKILIKDG